MDIISFLSSWTFEGVTFAIFVLVFVTLIWRLHRNPKSKFMIDNLFIENEKASVSKMGELIALVVSTWAIVHMVIKGTVTSDLFIGYLAAWVSNRGIRHWIDRKYKSNSE